jgi:DHA1 family bicyclomycin/chloramphenicol resistance-like MFS transporter
MLYQALLLLVLFIGSAPYIIVNNLRGNSADFGNWFLIVALTFMLGSLRSKS